MLEYYRKKLPHLIALFTRLHLEKTKRPLTMTQLFKYLAFLDFAAVKTWGRPVTGLNYVALPFGPVPEKLYEDLKQGKSYEPNLYQVVLKDRVVYIYPGKEIPDSDFFFRLGKRRNKAFDRNLCRALGKSRTHVRGFSSNYKSLEKGLRKRSWDAD